MEELQANQFCRACGTDLRRVRVAVEAPDSITASAASAREEIGRAIAMKIREMQGAEELSVVTEDVLPEIEKFLESPEEKRLRRMRTGMIISSVGFGAAVGISIVSVAMKDPEVMFLAGLGLITFFLGLGFIINGLIFTVPKKKLSDRSPDAVSQRELDDRAGFSAELNLPPRRPDVFPTVTEHTTQHLKEKEPVSRD